MIYIPTDSEIDQMNFSSAFPESAQRTAFKEYIAQDDYMSDNRGEYMERYGALAPWHGRWDVKFMQDYKIKVSENKTNTIQFSIDILNFGNLISSDWGIIEQPNNISPLAVNTSGSEPEFTFNPSQEKTFGYDSSLASRWQVQFGLRYIF